MRTIAAASMLIGTWLLAGSAARAEEHRITFSLFPNANLVSCLAAPGKTPTVQVTVRRGLLHDHMRVVLKRFKPGLGFDLFTVERSNQQSDGSPVEGFSDFGLAWYQSEIRTSAHPGETQIDTILLDKIFGFDPGVGLAPTQTLHVGFWFDDPAAAAPCGFAGPPTPFNETHNAGPVAFISRPDPVTGLGPLCTNPSSTVPATCNP